MESHSFNDYLAYLGVLHHIEDVGGLADCVEGAYSDAHRQSHLRIILPNHPAPSGILGAMDQEEASPQVGVGVVFVRDGWVFLAKREGSHGENTWASAGGHLEFGETLEECARREAMEELGVAVGEIRFLCVSNIISYGKHYLDIEFLGDIGDQTPRLMEEEGFTECGWFLLDSLPQPLFQAVSYALESLRTGSYYYPGDR